MKIYFGITGPGKTWSSDMESFDLPVLLLELEECSVLEAHRTDVADHYHVDIRVPWTIHGERL